MTVTKLKPSRPGQKPISFNKGGEHRSTGTPAGNPIPAAKKAAARSGKLGKLAKKQEVFRENVLVGKR